MTVLVTGATGYIGGRLVEHLLHEGFEVRAGTRSPGREGTAISWAATDYESPESLLNACSGCDAVVHLASLNEVECAKRPDMATLVNTIYAQRIAAAAAAAKARRFIYFSTVHVYGSPLAGRIVENTPLSPAHPYSISHRAAEDYLRWSAPESGMEVDVLRLTNSIGYPADRDVNRWTLVANDAARQAAATGKIVLRSSGAQLRDFIPLVDVCRATAFLAGREARAGAFEAYNLGGEYVASVYEIASAVAAAYSLLTGRDSPIERPEGRTEPRGELDVDIGKLKSLGFSLVGDPGEELRRLVGRCLEWFGP